MKTNGERSGVTQQPALPEDDDSFRYLANPETILVLLLDAAGRCEFVSPSLSAFTGRDSAREAGSGWLDHVHPEDRGPVERGLQEALRNGREARQLFRYRRDDGVFRWFVYQGMPRTGADGTPIGQVGLCFDVTACQEGDADAERAARLMIALLRQTRLIGVVVDTRGHIQFSNGGLCRLLKSSGVELMNRPLFERHLAPQHRSLLETLYPDGVQAAHFPIEFETGLIAGDGEYKTVSWHAMVLRDQAGNARNTILIGDDVTELRQTEEALSLSAKFFEASHHAMVVTTLDGSIIEVNAAFSVLTGYRREEALGQNPRILQSGRQDRAFYQQMWAKLLATGHWYGDIWDRRKDGSVYPKYLSISVIRNAAGEATHYAGIFYDISERKTVEERLDRLAHYDTLTGLPNRCLLMDRLEQAAEHATREGSKFGLLYLDLDHFKQVNDTLGHSAGDELLRDVAGRLRHCVRAVDTVARLGGDEFVVLVPGVFESADLGGVALKIIDALTPPCVIEGRPVVALASIGISVYPDDGEDVQALMKRADAAMYQVKQGGRGAYRFFHEMTPPAP